jgi:ArsR family transcriptional regulator
MPELPRLFANGRIARPDAEHLAATVRALADPSRMEILSILIGRPGATVTELIVALDRVSAPTVSHHLSVLSHAGLVSSVRDGRYVRYSAEWSALRAVSNAIRPAGAR